VSAGAKLNETARAVNAPAVTIREQFGVTYDLLTVLPQLARAVEDSENALEQAVIFVERHIEQEHAKPLLSVLKGVLGELFILDEDMK
jgi:hypothetical protein